MKAIVDNLKLTLDALLEIKIGMSKNTELLDLHKDFSEVNKLYQMNSEVYGVINDIFHKLFPEEMPWGCQTVITSWQNLFNANFHPMLYDALYKHYQQQQIDHDLYRLNQLADEADKRYNQLIAA